jgi:hypothetical protein
MMAQLTGPFFLATVTKTPRETDFSDATLVHVWGASHDWFQAGAAVFVQKRAAWTDDETGTTYPALYFVYTRLSACVALAETTAKDFLRCTRQEGKALMDTSGEAATIAERIEWELTR